MDNPLRRPEEILAFRSLRQILASKPRVLWTVGPADSVLTALQIMADKDIGFLVVLDQVAMVGVVSERDCARRVVLAKKSPETTPVADIMVRNVVTVDLSHTFADCLRLMHQHGIRHLPVVDNGKADRRRLDPRPAERGGRAPRQDHRRTRTRAADDFHIDGLSRSRAAARPAVAGRQRDCVMSLLIVLGALAFLMFVAYRGYSVILFAPVAALGAVLLTDPALVAPMFSSVFMEKMVGFVKNYFPVFMLGAVFGKVIELSGFSKSIVAAVIGLLGRERAVLSIVVVCAILTYGGVSLFVVVFAVYPFAAEMFRQSGIPKRLIPCTIALGAFTSPWMLCRARRRSRTSFRRRSSRRRPGPRHGSA